MAKEPINRDLITRLLKEGATGKQRDIYDDQITGFGVRIMPQGKKASSEPAISFIYRWTKPRDKPGTKPKQGRVTLGKVADGMDAERARERVLEEIRRIDLSTDTPAVRVLKHGRRVADKKTLNMPWYVWTNSRTGEKEVMEPNGIGGPREPDPATEGDLKVIRYAITQPEGVLRQAYFTVQRVRPSDDCAKALASTKRTAKPRYSSIRTLRRNSAADNETTAIEWIVFNSRIVNAHYYSST
jgi:hypothetical protein